MTIEKQLEMIRIALESGAKVDINFHGNKSKVEAEMQALTICEGLGLKCKEAENNGTGFFTTDLVWEQFSTIGVHSYFDPKGEKTA
jgi:hypothetical protein